MTNKPRPRTATVFAAAWLLLSLVMASWAFATPIGAAPDEPAHLIKAASVVRGEFIGQPSPHGEIVQVPGYVAYTHAQTCYAFASDVSADCIPDVPGNPAELVDGTTTAGLYNPAYYVLVGWPSLIAQDSWGIYAMRLVSAILVALFLAIPVALISTWRRPIIPMIGLAIATTPMVLFLGGTVNPNSIEIAATLAAFVAVFGVVRYPESVNIAVSSAIVVCAGAIAANMRGLSLLWLAVAILVPFVLASSSEILALLRRRSIQVAIGGTFIAAVAAAVWLLTSNSLGAALVEGDTAAAESSGGIPLPLYGFILTLLSTLSYALGIVGIFGWLDTQAPSFVYFTWSVLAGGLLLLGAVLLKGRALILSALLLASVLLLPPVLQGAYISGGGIIWQGRYILPLFVCLMVAVAALLSDRVELDRRTATVLTYVVFTLWGFAQFLSFATALRRYSVGLNDTWLDMFSPEWSPPGGLLALLALNMLVLIAIVGALIVHLQRNAPPLPAFDGASPTSLAQAGNAKG
ncbi:DUF2142 domain-containing protein [Rhodoglobus sp. NPDC076762]